MKRITLPGFQQVPLYDVVIFLIKEYSKNDITFRSYAITYTIVLSFFPALLVLFSLLPFFPLYNNFQDYIQFYIYEFVPGESANVVFGFIQDLLTRERIGLFTVSFILAIYFSSNGILAIMRTFEKKYPTTYKIRNIYKKRLIAILLTFTLGILLTSSLLLITAGTSTLNYLRAQFDLAWSYRIGLFSLQWLAITIFLYTAIAILYKYGAQTIKKTKFFSPGAFLSVFLCIVSSVGFALYIEYFSNYNKLFGSIGTVIIFMIWLQLNVLWVLIGYELNAGIAMNGDLKDTIEDTDPN